MTTIARLTLPAQLDNFDQNAKVWVYQSSRPFTEQESALIQNALRDFAMQWTAHNQQLKAAGLLLLNRIIVLVVDETQAGASGCSIDTSVHFIQSLEKSYNVQLFDRMIVNYMQGDTWMSTTVPEISALSADVVVFDPLVANLGALRNQAVNALSNTWMASFLN